MSATDWNKTRSSHHYGVQHVTRALHDTLAAYIEAQYHIRNESLIRERHLLLHEKGSIAQRPYVEATPVYQTGISYNSIDAPSAVRDLLSDLSQMKGPGVGIFDPPYVHQVRALESFFAGDDLVVATGTGSGKTESFLMPILGELALEAGRSRPAAQMPGMRALLLYPLNALVSDQLARVRRLLGDVRVADRLSRGRGRRIRFGMYTSRTPYPGLRSSERDQRDVKPLFEEFYLLPDGNRGWTESAQLRNQLQPTGRWPCKDLAGFYGRRGSSWANRLLTQPGDTELFTRQEIQRQCPDLLVTNYSMLEYMLLRPIERDIFSQTRQWLESDPDGKLILVLDEAHTYRGSGGAEVAMLIRRLQARLNIPRDRFRCILTSASLGHGEEAEKSIVQFAKDLTGLDAGSHHSISLVPATREKRHEPHAGSDDEARSLHDFDLAGFQSLELGNEQRGVALTAVSRLAKSLGWPQPTSADLLPNYLFDRLTGWAPVELLIESISGAATEFGQLSAILFPTSSENIRDAATETLLVLATYAKRKSEDNVDRVLLPSRMHLFFRGLPTQYVCTNPNCGFRRDRTAGPYILGRLHTRPLVSCNCGSRTYELLTHRRCGTAFLQGYTEGPTGTFLWHEPSGLIGLDPTAPLCRTELLVEAPHPDSLQRDEVVRVWLDHSTGRLEYCPPSDPALWLPLFLPRQGADISLRSFTKCPVCQKSWRADRNEIMDLVTKGEAPFSNLVKSQVLTQPPRHPRSLKSPNEGRKVLLFSDGRQKAARLARDIPREVEQDSFRQTLVLAVNALRSIAVEARPTSRLYVAFVSVAAEHSLAYFDGSDQRDFVSHIREFQTSYTSLDEADHDRWEPTPIPARYLEALLRQFCSRFYALSSTTLGHVCGSSNALRNFGLALKRFVPQQTQIESEALARALSVAWIGDSLQDHLAFGGSGIGDQMRSTVAGYYGNAWGIPGNMSKIIGEILCLRTGVDSRTLGDIHRLLLENFCGPEINGRYFLDPNKLNVQVGLNDEWFQCQDCTFLSPVCLLNSCSNCGGDRVLRLDPHSDEYLKSRKGFWRNSMGECLAARERPSHVCAEEHTAQLSFRDKGEVYATTEEFELRFQDIVLEGRENEGPIDVLSCTTTMEVGVDIGSLVAVGLRNVPPQRENYQQRAGRAGRRGSAVSTVVTYSQEGPHDGYYYAHPAEMVSGTPRRPILHVSNPRIARRHVHAYLIQTFFHELIDQGVPAATGNRGELGSSLGTVAAFFNAAGGGFTLTTFRTWIDSNVLLSDLQTSAIVRWLPKQISAQMEDWVRTVSSDFVRALDAYAVELIATPAQPEELLLDFLFDRGVLPTYAFPTALASFQIETSVDTRVQIVEQPQQALNRALSEYAPGRFLVINKLTYRSAGVGASVLPNEVNRAAPLFQNTHEYVFCEECSFVHMPERPGQPLPDTCPLCNHLGDLRRETIITPETFFPEGSSPLSPMDRDQDFTYATSAQLPVPVGTEVLGAAVKVGSHASLYAALDQRLVVVNRGEQESNDGFWVCNHCGASRVADDSSPPPHPPRRPYFVQSPVGTRVPPCQGTFQKVFLGNQFLSDLMLLRVSIDEPFGYNLSDRVFRCALENALRTFGEALLLATSRHMDIDPSEMSSGFRLLPREDSTLLRADIYLFDTLSGGAGYSEQAGSELTRIFDVMSELLMSCSCDTSCQSCLRHYGNRFYHESLDRHLASALLGYIRYGKYPVTDDLSAQAQVLGPLRRMFELDGFRVETNLPHGHLTIPLWVARGEQAAAIGTYHGLLWDQSLNFKHPLNALRGHVDADIVLANEFRLSRNLPGAYSDILKVLGN